MGASVVGFGWANISGGFFVSCVVEVSFDFELSYSVQTHVGS